MLLQLDPPLSIALPPKEHKTADKRRIKVTQQSPSMKCFPTSMATNFIPPNPRSRSAAAAFANALKCAAESQLFKSDVTSMFPTNNLMLNGMSNRQNAGERTGASGKLDHMLACLGCYTYFGGS